MHEEGRRRPSASKIPSSEMELTWTGGGFSSASIFVRSRRTGVVLRLLAKALQVRVFNRVLGRVACVVKLRSRGRYTARGSERRNIDEIRNFKNRNDTLLVHVTDFRKIWTWTVALSPTSHGTRSSDKRPFSVINIFSYKAHFSAIKCLCQLPETFIFFRRFC